MIFCLIFFIILNHFENVFEAAFYSLLFIMHACPGLAVFLGFAHIQIYKLSYEAPNWGFFNYWL